LVLVPAGLLEFRYFSNSLLFLGLEIENLNLELEKNKEIEEKVKHRNTVFKFLKLNFYILINVSLLLVFLYKTFDYIKVNEDGSSKVEVGRFMF
jgi:hypothetical protein